MVRLNRGMILKEIKTGNSERGAYAFSVVKAEKGYDKITVFAHNADEVKAKRTYTIGEIVSVTKTAHKGENKNGEEVWYDDYQVNAVFKEEEPTDGFEKLSTDEIPF